MPTEELVRKYDAEASHTSFGAGFYREEIHRRDQGEQTKRIVGMTKAITAMTGVMTVATVLNIAIFLGGCGAPDASDQEEARPGAAAETPPAIDAWLTGWSEGQAGSIRETCEQDPQCDSSQYLPEARPETSFGWDGADAVEQIDDWADGPRYQVEANGRTIIMYLRDGEIVGVDLMMPSGERRNLCRDEECNG
jgi:hypothetical protein